MAEKGPQLGWITRKRMVASLNMSDSGFSKWGVEPIAKIGRDTYYRVRDVIENRARARRRELDLCEECGYGIEDASGANKKWIAFCPTCNHPVDGSELFSMNYFKGK